MPLLGYAGFHDFLHPVIARGHEIARANMPVQLPEPGRGVEGTLAGISIIVALAGIVFARLVYVWAPALANRMADSFAAAYQVLLEKYRVDEIYETVVVNNYQRFCRASQWFDDEVIIAGLNGLAQSVVEFGLWVRRVQSGLVLHYAIATLLGMVFLTVWMLLCS